MDGAAESPGPPPAPRDRRGIFANAGLWATGNGLVSSQLISYLALALGATERTLGWIFAAPQLAGALRLATPWLLARLGSRRTFCRFTYAASAAVLFVLPACAAPGRLPVWGALAALVLLWSTYHLLEYLATVALWAWIGDLTTPATRGQFIGRRERWLLFGRIGGTLATATFSAAWMRSFVDTPHAWLAFVIPTCAGAVAMGLATLPLGVVADVAPREPVAASAMPTLWAPLRQSAYRRLFYFGLWFSLANGLTQAVQTTIPRNVLKWDLWVLLGLATAMRLGQSLVSPWCGRWADRHGSKRLMIASQTLVTLGLLCYYFASPQRPVWLAVAWVLWIAYAGLNVGLPHVMLQLAPHGNAAPGLALFYAATGVTFAIGSIAGGHLAGELATHPQWYAGWPLVASHYDVLILGGVIVRGISALLLCTLHDDAPPATPSPPAALSLHGK